MEISALTRSVVKHGHALICPDGYVKSTVPGWTACTVNILINGAMGAGFCQTLIILSKNGRLTGKTKLSQVFFYIVNGKCSANVGTETRTLNTCQFVYVPVNSDYLLEHAEEGTQILIFQKVYEHLEGQKTPFILFGDSANIEGQPFLGDEALQLKVLLPDNLSFDMAVNIFTFAPGGHLPFVETHIMEHGLLFLDGQGVYRLGENWYPVKKGDTIWMAPYCQQWFTAMGQQPAVYIYYKNVNRHPSVL